MSDASSAYFTWRHYHPRESEDPQALWAAAWREGGLAALRSSSRLADLGHLLRELLYRLEDEHVETEVRSSDRRGPWLDDDECQVAW